MNSIFGNWTSTELTPWRQVAPNANAGNGAARFPFSNVPTPLTSWISFHGNLEQLWQWSYHSLCFSAVIHITRVR